MHKNTLALAISAALFACSGGKSDDSSTAPTGTATATGTGTGTGTGGSTGAELCDDGVDNDVDGLLDCEDDDCATDPSCIEQDCADGVDNDGDGRMDCTDEDCWGHGCEVTVATLVGMDHVHVESRQQRGYALGGASCSGSTYMFNAQVGLTNPRGTVRHMPATTPQWTTCDWGADTSWITGSSSSFVYNGTPAPVTRYGFQIDVGCPIQTSGFLPEVWTLGLPGGGNTLEVHTRPSGTGPLWFTLNIYGAYNQTSFSSSTTIPGSPCSQAVNVSGASGNWYAVAPGQPYTEANP